jgi:argininosuccinate lyase
MILFSSQEYGFIELPEGYSTGSSAMPQKKNPDLLELVRGKSGRVVGHAMGLIVTVKGLPLAYNKDLQETQEPLFGAADTLLQMLPLVTGWMKAVEFHVEKMTQAAQSGFVNAWAAATYLVQRGVPSRIAHEKIGKAVQLCLERNCELQDLPLGELKSLSPAFDQDFYESLKLAYVLAVHDVPGGTAPARVRQAISATRIKIDSLREELHAQETHAHA